MNTDTAGHQILMASRPLTSDTVVDTASFFCALLGHDEALLYLKKVINTLEFLGSGADASDGPIVPGAKRSRTGDTSEAHVNEAFVLPPATFTAADVPFRNDMVDTAPMTFIAMLPDEVKIIASIIGKGGSRINSINSSTGCKVQFEKKGLRPADPIKYLVFQGSIRSIIDAFVQVYSLANENGNVASLEVIKFAIPNEMVSRTIGKGGCVLKELRENSGVQKIEIQQEAEMIQRAPLGFYGRTLMLQGSWATKLNALYLILRHLSEDKQYLPEAWRGKMPKLMTSPAEIESAHGKVHAAAAAASAASQASYGVGRQPQYGNTALAGAGTGGMPGTSGMVPMAPMGYPGHPGQPSYFAPGPAAVPQQSYAGAQMPSAYGAAVPMANHITISSDKQLVGTIIGSKGSHIDEVFRTTGCRINISPDTGAETRVVAVEGTDPMQINVAVEMVNRKIQDWMRKNGQMRGY